MTVSAAGTRKKKGPPPAERLGFTPRELAPPLGLSVGTIYNRIIEGKIAIVQSMLPLKIIPRLEAQRLIREVIGDPEWSIADFEELAALRRGAQADLFAGEVPPSPTNR